MSGDDASSALTLLEDASEIIQEGSGVIRALDEARRRIKVHRVRVFLTTIRHRAETGGWATGQELLDHLEDDASRMVFAEFLEKVSETPSETPAIALGLLYSDYDSGELADRFLVRRLANSLMQLDTEMVEIFCWFMQRYERLEEDHDDIRAEDAYPQMITREGDLGPLLDQLDEDIGLESISLVLPELERAGLFLPDPNNTRWGGDPKLWAVGIGEQTHYFYDYLREAKEIEEELSLA